MRYGLLRFGSLLLFASLLLPSVAFAQGRMMGGGRGQQPGVERVIPETYKLPGFRHGVGFFPQVQHPGVEYEAGRTLTFDRYHTADVMYEWLHRWEEQYPNLVNVWEVDKSFEGRPILMASITNEATGPATDKAAAYFEGGRHSGEVTSSESVLWLMQHILEGYGRDPEITHLVDTRAIYFRPQNNPDGGGMYLNTAQSNRSTNRPYDNDGDGLLDEDPPEDLNGDGIILQVRYLPRPGTDDRATMVLDERDPSGRIMRRAQEGEEAVWCVTSEGIDNDGDGRVNEDGIGGLDLHRNYGENWRPMASREATGRGYTQGGAGAFPLSEIETRSVVVWLLENPNVSVVNSMDTRVPMHLRAPSTSPGAERMYPEDLAYYEYFDSVGLAITDYGRAGDVFEDYGRGRPIFGHGPDWGYWYYGSIWYGDELWGGESWGDLNGDGDVNQFDALIWDDQENQGRAFTEWASFNHPVYGEAESGGFHPKFYSQNPPVAALEEWIEKQALFNLAMAKHLPLLEMEGVTVRKGDTEGDLTTYEVDVTWKNSGGLPSALSQAWLVKVVREDRAMLEFDRALIGGEEPTVRMVGGASVTAEFTDPGETTSATFQIQVRGSAAVEGTVRVLSTRGGVLEQSVRVGGN